MISRKSKAAWTPFVAIKVGLALGKVESIGGSNLTEIPATVTVYVLRLGYRRFQTVFVAKTMQSAPRFNLVAMNCIDLLAREKDRVLFQVRLFSQTAKQTGVQGAGFPVSFFELLIRGVADFRGFPVHVRRPALLLGCYRGHRLGFPGDFLLHSTPTIPV